MADLDTIHTLLVDIARESAANGAKLEALDNRLFAASSGVMPGMWGEIKSAKADAAAAAAVAAKANEKVNNQRAYVAGFSAAGILFGGALKALLGKMGWNF
jgi:hypothetical protein